MEYFNIESKFFIDTVNFSLTYRCNLRCPCCYQHKGDDELDTDQVLALIDKLGRWRVKTLMLGGGEPLLREDILEIVKSAHIYGMNVYIGTNGMLIDRRLARELRNAGTSIVFLGLDDPRNPVNKEGGDIDYRSKVASLREADLRAVANLIVTHQMVSSLKDTIQVLKDMGFDGVNILRPRPDSALGEWYKNACLTSSDIEKLHIDRLRLHHELGFEISLDCSFGMLLFGIFSSSYYRQLGARGCSAARGYFHIDPLGNVFPCPYLASEEFRIGNFLDDGFSREWIQSPIVKMFSNTDNLEGKCHGCSLRDVCAGCRALALYENGNILSEDPHCPFGEHFSIRKQIEVYKEMIKIIGPELLD